MDTNENNTHTIYSSSNIIINEQLLLRDKTQMTVI